MVHSTIAKFRITIGIIKKILSSDLTCNLIFMLILFVKVFIIIIVSLIIIVIISLIIIFVYSFAPGQVLFKFVSKRYDCLRAIYRIVKQRIISDHQRVSTGGRTLPGGGGWIWKQMTVDARKND